MSDVKSTLRQFIVENFLFGDDDGFEDDTSFLEQGIIDSTGMLELITFLEEEFSLQLDDEELIPENLDSLNNLEAFLAKKQAVQQPQ
ncbi:MAG: acyl carrier protein [Desulfobacteraceae bacterium]|nr:acyl carrier protein [Desulfobacteraceae bacterium]MCF8096014.1 acyl carrier protein [Desulfobacteraceae bacterium]